jgi:small subunit ribosomal protein S11e
LICDVYSYSLSQAKEGNYIDKKCPFTGNVSIRGRILTGVVKSLKMKRLV